MIKYKSIPREKKSLLEYLLIFMGIGLFAAVVIYIAFFPSKKSIGNDRKVSELEERISYIEKKMKEMETEAENFLPDPELTDRIRSVESATEGLKIAHESSQAYFNDKISGISDRLADLSKKHEEYKVTEKNKATAVQSSQEKEKKRESSTPVKDTKKKIEKASSSTSVVKKDSPVYHHVKQGDTFYSICRRYGITLKQLKDMNNFSETAKIYPGQKVVVRQ